VGKDVAVVGVAIGQGASFGPGVRRQHRELIAFPSNQLAATLKSLTFESDTIVCGFPVKF
jgi:hypothetical protein